MDKTYELLKWDTEFFGYKIAQLNVKCVKSDALLNILKELKSERIKLAYWSVASDDLISNNSANLIGAKLVDEKLTYLMPLLSKMSLEPSSNVDSYKYTYPNNKLVALALQSGVYSRFNMDENFRNKEFERLYIRWIENSVNKKMAKDVLVYLKDNTELGLITLGIKNNRGDIGLLAVDKRARRKSVGKELMQTAMAKFREWGIAEVQVVAQRANTAACKFYESCGFALEKTENIYHIWL